MNEQDLSDAMRASLPRRPDVRGWADGARRRARNRRVGVSAAALALVALIATPLVIQHNREAPPNVVLATPSPTTVEAAQLLPDACVDPVADAEPLVDDELPDGAERLWLCGRSDPANGVAAVGHPDPLADRADDALAAFNALPAEVGVLDCMPGPMPDYLLVAEYADGTHRTVQTAGCGELRDATDSMDVFRADGAGYLTVLQELWAAEREHTGFRFVGTEGLCDVGPWSVNHPIEPTALSRVIACAELPDGTRRAVELDDQLTTDVIASFVAVGNGGAGDARLGARPATIILLTPSGDPVSLIQGADGIVWSDGHANYTWDPPTELLDRIEAARTAAPAPTGETPPPAPTTPGATVELPDERGEGLAPEVCRDVQDGTLQVDDLPATEMLDEGAARVWLCGHPNAPGIGGTIGPVEPLVTDPDRVVRAINDLPASEAEACTEIGGLVYSLAIDYPDGTRRVIRAETVNCTFVGGVDGWGGREGGDLLLEEVTSFWDAQRDAVPEAFTADVELCDADLLESGAAGGLQSFLPVDPPTFYRGSVCGLTEATEGADAEVVQRELPGDVVLAVGQSVGPGSGEPVPEGMPYVVMLNQYGDPVTYPVTEDLALLHTEGSWTPDGDLAERWASTLEGLRTTPV